MRHPFGTFVKKINRKELLQKLTVSVAVGTKIRNMIILVILFRKMYIDVIARIVKT